MSGQKETEQSLLREELISMRPRDFVYKRLLPARPQPFNTEDEYLKWRENASLLLEVESCDVHIVGSRLLGYSLNPHHPLRAVQADSDLDVAVVSHLHFESGWHGLRWKPPMNIIDNSLQKHLDWHKSDLIFRGIIAVDLVVSLLPFAKDWMAAIDLLQKEKNTKDMEISIRLFRDHKSFIDGLERSVATLTTALTRSTAQ